MPSVIDDIRELQRKSALYDRHRERYIDFAKELRAITEKIDSMIKEIDPVIKGGGETVRRNKYTDQLTELYDKMVSGIHLNSDLIRATYPDYDESSIYYLMTELGKMNGVQKRKEGRTLFLFHEDA